MDALKIISTVAILAQAGRTLYEFFRDSECGAWRWALLAFNAVLMLTMLVLFAELYGAE